MKRSLLALAVLGAFAGAASAQSSVTLYGLIDVNLSSDKVDSGDVTMTIHPLSFLDQNLGNSSSKLAANAFGCAADVGQTDLDTLVERVTAGRVTPLVAHLLERHKLSAAEIKELKALVAAAERKSRGRQS